MSRQNAKAYNQQELTWTKDKPKKVGWYWMLNPDEEPGLPTVVQLVYDWESRHLVALIPASRYPTLGSAVVDPEKFEALWAGPLAIPSIARASHRAALIGQQDDDDGDIAA